MKTDDDVLRVTGCSGNIVFSKFTATPPSPYIAVRDLQSSQRNASVQALIFSERPIAAQ